MTTEAINKLNSNHFYSDKDVSLTFSHLACMACKRLSDAAASTFLATPLSIPYWIARGTLTGSIYQRIPNWKKKPLSLLKMAASPLLLLVGRYIPFVTQIHTAANLIGVASVAIPKLYTCLRYESEDPLTAFAGCILHTLNLAFQWHYAPDMGPTEST